jgi:hypothetical protein
MGTKTELKALLETQDPPVHYGLTLENIQAISQCFDWDSRFPEYETTTLAIEAHPESFLADISRYYGDDYYLD